MKPFQKLLQRLIRIEEAVSGIISSINKIKADVEYIAMMTDTDIIIEGENSNEQKPGV